MNKQKEFQAFTLVELIVVISILAILSTIGLVSYSSYLVWVRDTNRTWNLNVMSNWLEVYRAKFSLPSPEDSVEIKANGTLIAYQWYAWENVLETIKFSNDWTDPKTDAYYSYYLTKDKKYFQLMWLLEENSQSIVYGKKLGILVWAWADLNTPIQEIEDIKTAWSLDIATTTGSYISYFKNWEEYASWTWSVLYKLEEVASVWWYKCWTTDDFIYCLWPDWSIVDFNCKEEDVLIWKQIWAGCNSTLWDGIEFIKNDVSSCYDYNWVAWQICSEEQNLSTVKENSWNPNYGIDNIWWKLYTWDNSPSACTFWRHVPSDEEWSILENTLFWSICAWATYDRDWDSTADWDGLWCDGLWWKDHTTKTSSNNMVEALKMPLAGGRYIDGVKFYGRGEGIGLRSSDPDGTEAVGRVLFSGDSRILRESWDKAYEVSVRCIKD